MISAGEQVRWERVDPPGPDWLVRGFGSFEHANVGQVMRIHGDYGIRTSLIKSVEEIEGGIKVITVNSTYVVKGR